MYNGVALFEQSQSGQRRVSQIDYESCRWTLGCYAAKPQQSQTAPVRKG